MLYIILSGLRYILNYFSSAYLLSFFNNFPIVLIDYDVNYNLTSIKLPDFEKMSFSVVD